MKTGKMVLTLVVGAVLCLGWSRAAAAAELLWNQPGDNQSQYGPSVRNAFSDQEIADDFVLDAEITRVIAFGTRGFSAPLNPVVDGFEVRFYAVTADGKPGAQVAQYILASGDPNLVYDPVNPKQFEVTLSPPFQASGHYFLGVQALIEGSWYRASAGKSGTRGSHFWVRDNAAGGGWEIYNDGFVNHFDDVAFALQGNLTAPAIISSLSHSERTPSGRVRIFGDNLGSGAAGSSVTIGGQPAWIGEWTDVAIHAYVPEGVAPGTVQVAVTTSAGLSSEVPLTVVPRQQVGRLRWRFTCDGLAIRNRPGIGPDGSVYAQDIDGLLYALSSDGGLQWILDTEGQGGEGPVVVADDGTIFVTSNPLGPITRILAVNPDGTVKWTFNGTQGQGIIAGPAVGPDGHLYAVLERPGLGVLSLDAADGSLRWSNLGAPAVNDHGGLGQEIAFGVDRLFVAFDEFGENPISLLYGMSLDGSQLFAVGRPNNGAQPVTDSVGNVYLQTWGAGSGIRLGSHDSDGNPRWTAFTSPTNTLSHPTIGPDGTLYVVRNLIQLAAVDQDGSILWNATTDEALFSGPVVSPDGGQLIAAGLDFGVRSFFRAFSAADGALRWEEELAQEGNGTILTVSTRAIFSADGDTAFAGVEPLSNPIGNRHCYLYALDTNQNSLFADGFESGTMSSWTMTVTP